MNIGGQAVGCGLAQRADEGSAGSVLGIADSAGVRHDMFRGESTRSVVGKEKPPHNGFGVGHGLVDHHDGVVFGIGYAVERQRRGGDRVVVQEHPGSCTAPMEHGRGLVSLRLAPGRGGQEEQGGQQKCINLFHRHE